MLEIKNMSKSFDDNVIIDNFNVCFETGKIYGILGTNGAGKSTFLRTISGIYKPTKGEVKLDGEDVFCNELPKSEIIYIPDENVYFPEKSIDSSIKFFSNIYGEYDKGLYEELKKLFGLDTKKDVKSFSKGMKKQALLMIHLVFKPKYVIFDETFDGLDPFIRVKLKEFLIGLVEELGICLIVSTHNISDIENLIDELIIINNKTLVLENPNEDKYLKAQLAFSNEVKIDELKLNILSNKSFGSVSTIVVKNTREELDEAIKPLNPLVYDVYQLTKEEIFIQEVEGLNE